MPAASKFCRTAWMLWMLAVPLQAQIRLPAPPGGAIVELRDGAPATLDRFRRDLGAIAFAKTWSAEPLSIRGEYSTVFHGVALRADRETLAAIAALPYVKTIHPDQPVHALSDRVASPQRAPVRLPRGLGTRGEGVIVAVLDTGIDYMHPALGGGFGPGFKVAGGYDFVNRDADPRDDNGHGTHVAGIIAADSAEMTGVAPGATLLAYKVLDAYGSGQQSGVIAALERAVDPNGDGSPADHVDVVNLSLGGTGTPDDPQSLAVDAAVAAGVIVCAAAGNDGEAFAIISPGTARSAITVGAATDDGRVAPFSSRGPCVKLVSIKPDVLAPGVGIRSTVPGGKFETMDGTSMATPHVAGACALLRAVHPDWTPAQVKAAITMTARPVSMDVMTEGGGVIDVAAAIDAPLLASDSHFDLGLASQQGGTWRRTRSIAVTNAGRTALAYSVAVTASDASVSARATPPVLELQPGASGTVTLTVSIENEDEIADAAPLLRGGFVTLSASGRSLHFAWAALSASRAILTAEQSYCTFHILSPGLVPQPLWLSPNAAEVYLAAGTYDVAAVGYEWNERAMSVSFVSAPVLIAGDVALHFTRSDAPYAISLRGTGAGRYLGRFRIYTPGRTFDLLTADGVLSTSPLPSTFAIKAAEIAVDPSANRIVALQYPLLTGVSKDEVFAAADLKRQRMRFVFAGSAAPRQISVYSVAIESDAAFVTAYDVAGSVWQGELYANEECAGGHVMAVALHASTDIVTPALRVRNGRFVATDALTPSPLLYTSADDELVTYGDGPALIAPHVQTLATTLHTCVRVVGAAGETRPRAAGEGRFTVFDSAEQVVVRQQTGSIDTTLVPPGRQRVEFVTAALSTDYQPMRATLSVTIDSNSADAAPPTITSIAVVDAAHRLTPELKRGEAGALLFTAADSDAAQVWFRESDAAEWVPLAAVQTADDPPLGLQYRVDLSAATAGGGTTVDLRISLADAAGNLTTLTLEPAFAVTSPLGKRRAVR